MKIRILGSGEAFDHMGYGNNACVLFGSNIPTILFDCGYQIPERLWCYPNIYKNLDAIYFTHMHADHAFGIVPLLTRYKEEGRKTKLHIFGPKGIQRYVERVVTLGYPGTLKTLPFKLVFKELKSGDQFGYKNLKFLCARSIHPVVNLSVRVNGPTGKSFAVSGDGSMTPATQKIFSDVNLLLHEVFWLKSKGPTHCDLESLSQYVQNSKIQRVAVMHVSRQYRVKMNQVVQKLHTADKRYFIGQPGQLITV